MDRPDIEGILSKVKARIERWAILRPGRRMLEAPRQIPDDFQWLKEVCEYVLYLESQGHKIVEAVDPELQAEFDAGDECCGRGTRAKELLLKGAMFFDPELYEKLETWDKLNDQAMLDWEGNLE